MTFVPHVTCTNDRGGRFCSRSGHCRDTSPSTLLNAPDCRAASCDTSFKQLWFFSVVPDYTALREICTASTDHTVVCTVSASPRDTDARVSELTRLTQREKRTRVYSQKAAGDTGELAGARKAGTSVESSDALNDTKPLRNLPCVELRLFPVHCPEPVANLFCLLNRGEQLLDPRSPAASGF